MKKIVMTRALRGKVLVPGDKSISHRSVMLGSIAEGDTYVRGFLKSADCLATIACFRKMGIEIEERRGETARLFGTSEVYLPPGCRREEEPCLVIHGKGLRGLKDPGEVLDAMNSGTTVRLMSGILAGQGFVSHITGDESLRKRPMGRIIKPLSYMGIMCATENGSERLPMTVFGGTPHGIRYASPIASAQVKSCVLLAGLYAQEPTFYSEPVLSRNHTELMLDAFGGNLKVRRRTREDPITTILYPGTILKGQRITVPGDISSAAYFLAAGLIVPDSVITVRHVGINETRDGILRVIRAMDGDLTVENVRIEGSETVADLTVRSSMLRGTTIEGSIIPTLIDEIPIIAVLAACAKGNTVIRDAGELKVKESNRLAGIVAGLRSMGIRVEETEDGMVIEGGRSRLTGARIDPGGDHRMAMAFSIAGLAAKGTTEIVNDSCVAVSWPTFYEDLYHLG